MKGATIFCGMSRRIFCYFNPRTREGCDDDSASSGDPLSYFNPRTREGCDVCNGDDVAVIVEFQSTHP